MGDLSGDYHSEQIDNKNPDDVNPVYKKQYELAYTERKVNKTQTNLDARADSQVKGWYSVWKQGFRKEGHPAYGLSFEVFASEALSRSKDDVFKNELGHLPHVGEFAKNIKFDSYTKSIAKYDQEFRDETKSKVLIDAVNSIN